MQKRREVSLKCSLLRNIPATWTKRLARYDSGNTRFNRQIDWVINQNHHGELGFWLYGAHRVMADMNFEVRCFKSQIEVRNLKSSWNWFDEIDARPINVSAAEIVKSREADVPIGFGTYANAIAEGLIMDGLIERFAQPQFFVNIKWTYDRPKVVRTGIPCEAAQCAGAN